MSADSPLYQLNAIMGRVIGLMDKLIQGQDQALDDILDVTFEGNPAHRIAMEAKDFRELMRRAIESECQRAVSKAVVTYPYSEEEVTEILQNLDPKGYNSFVRDGIVQQGQKNEQQLAATPIHGTPSPERVCISCGRTAYGYSQCDQCRAVDEHESAARRNGEL